ncbi:MAG: acetoacetate--CoA ligase [Ilumatobacteraceae bacterium]
MGDLSALWTPSEDRLKHSRLYEFSRWTQSQRTDTNLDYAPLHAWSVAHLKDFWSAVWEFCGMQGERGERVFVADSVMTSARFFPDASLSVVENMLSRAGDGDALVAIDEDGNRQVRSWDELAQRVACVAGALSQRGVVAGDRVAVWLPNGIEAIEVMLGAASIGAIFSSCSPDFGVTGVLDRFSQIEPKILVAVDAYRYNEKNFDCLERLAEIHRQLPSLVDTVLVSTNLIAHSSLPYTTYNDFVASGAASPKSPQRFPFDHPWYVLYSSGTTGVPKCIVHRTGGVLIQHLKEHQLHCDIRSGDRVMYFTTTGWMMWNWSVSVLASGATAVLFDGAPMTPSVTRLFDIVDSERVTLLGVSAKYIDSLRKADVQPINTHSLASLRTICSTGSPLAPDGFEWVYESVKRDVHLASISGGTDICACFVGGDPTSSVYAGEIQRPALGMDSDVVDDNMVSLATRPDTSGELVCLLPFPSIPFGFWNDGVDGLPSPTHPGPKFQAAYFEHFPGIWTQGDFASRTQHAGFVIHGRSDSTLNPGGVRIGTAEIYRVVEQHPDVIESLVFGQEWQHDVRIVLLVRLIESAQLTDSLVNDLKQRIRIACTPRHVPAIVLQVADLPRTRSNKLVELALADAVNGRPVRNREALANPEAIDAIVARPELRE